MKAMGNNVVMQVRSEESNQPALWSLCLTAQAEPKWASGRRLHVRAFCAVPLQVALRQRHEVVTGWC